MAQERSLKFNYIVRTLVSFGEMGLSLLVFPYVAKVLGPENLGKFDYVIATVTYVTSLCTLGTVEYGIREVAKSKYNSDSLKKSLSTLFTLRIQLSLLGFILYVSVVLPLLGEFDNYLFWISGILILLSFLNNVWVLDGLEDYTYLAAIRIISKFILIGYLRLFVVNESDLYAYLYGYIISEVMFFLTATIRASLKYKIFIKFDSLYRSFNLKLIKTLLTIFFLNLLSSTILSFPSLFLGKMGYFKDQGFYSVAMRFFWISYYCIVPMTVVLLPRSYRNIESSMKQLSSSFIILTTLSFAVSFGLLSVSGDIINLFVGKEYEFSIVLLKYLALVCVIFAFNNFWGMQIIFAKHKESLLIKSNIIVFSLMVTIGSYSIYIYKSLGAVIAVLMTQLLLSILYFMIGKKYFRLDLTTILEVSKGFVSSVIMYTVIRDISADSMFLLALKIILGGVLFGCALIILRFKIVVNILTNIKDRMKNG